MKNSFVNHLLSDAVLDDLKNAIDDQIQRSFTNYANIDFDNLITTFESSTSGIPNEYEIGKYQETCQLNGGCIKPITKTIDIEPEDIVSYINMGDKINLDNYP